MKSFASSLVIVCIGFLSHPPATVAQANKSTPAEYERAVQAIEKLSRAETIKRSYFDMAIVASRLIQPRLDDGRLRKPIREMAALAKKMLGKETDGKRIAQVLNNIIFKKYGFKNPKSIAPIISGKGIFETYALPGLLKGKKGYCEGLSTVYLLVAEEAGLPVEIIGLPVHVMCKVRGKNGDVYVECTRAGQLTSAVRVPSINGAKPAASKSGVYFSPYTKHQFLNMHVNALAYGLIKQPKGPAPLNIKQMVRLAEVIERLAPKSPEPLETAALIHHTAGNSKRALKMINRVLERANEYGAPGFIMRHYQKMQRLYQKSLDGK